MFQVSGNAPIYAKCICTPPQSACEMEKHAAISVSLLCLAAWETWWAIGLADTVPETGSHHTHNTLHKHHRWTFIQKRGLHSEPCWLLSTMHNTFSAENTKDVHPCNKPKQGKKKQHKKQQKDRNALGKKKIKKKTKRWSGTEVENHTKLWTQKRGKNNSVSISIKPLLPPP